MSDEEHPGVVFLGLCERAAYVRDGNTNLFKWNVIGLKHIVLSYIYPTHLAGWSIGFAFQSTSALAEQKFRLTDESGTEVGFVNVSATAASPNDPDAVLRMEGPTLLVPQQGWTAAFLPLKDLGFFIQTPGIYHLRHVTPHGDRIVGELQFAVLDPPPLTQERIAAIRSDPVATAPGTDSLARARLLRTIRR